MMEENKSQSLIRQISGSKNGKILYNFGIVWVIAVFTKTTVLPCLEAGEFYRLKGYLNYRMFEDNLILLLFVILFFEFFRLNFGLNPVLTGFKNIHIAFLIWSLVVLISFFTYPMFMLWASLKKNLNSKGRLLEVLF